MDLRLKGRTALVTGASKGIGLAVVQTLAAEGVRVAGVARSAVPGAALSITADLSGPEGPAAAVARAREELGGIDILVNNVGGVRSGIAHGESFADLTDEHWQQALDLNLFSAVRTTRAALPALLEARGVIINVSSIGARFAHPPVEYGAAKAALTNLSKALSEELGPRGVRVVTVSPGPTLTENWKGADSMAADLAREAGVSHAEFLAELPRQMGIATRRLAEPAETAALIAFLASPHAANITGADYFVDGGVIKTV
ncbi:oxidoreductase [Streptomyces physcomitrii]|uniref:oxidoreductase n=1 Tax=Streptomyces physcomitrii TaxID=2724184 RepID=UPI00343F5960